MDPQRTAYSGPGFRSPQPDWEAEPIHPDNGASGDAGSGASGVNVEGFRVTGPPYPPPLVETADPVSFSEPPGQRRGSPSLVPEAPQPLRRQRPPIKVEELEAVFRKILKNRNLTDELLRKEFEEATGYRLGPVSTSAPASMFPIEVEGNAKVPRWVAHAIDVMLWSPPQPKTEPKCFADRSEKQPGGQPGSLARHASPPCVLPQECTAGQARPATG